MEIIFATSNSIKKKEFNDFFSDKKNIKVNYINAEVDEIQSLILKEIVKDKAEKLKKYITKENQILVVDDTSLGFKCLNYFPGTLIKYFMQKLFVKGMLELLNKYLSREVEYKCGFGIIYKNNFYYIENCKTFNVKKLNEIKGNIDQNKNWDIIIDADLNKETPRIFCCQKLYELVMNF